MIQLDGSVFLLSQSNSQVPHGYVGVTFQQYSGKVVPMTSVSGGPLGHFVFMTGTDLQSYLRQEPGNGLPQVPAYCAPLKVRRRFACMERWPRFTNAQIHLMVLA